MADLNVQITLTARNRTDRAVRGAEKGLKRLRKGGRELSRLDIANRAARDVNELSANLSRTGNQLSRLGRRGRDAIGAVLTPTIEYGKAIAEVSTLVDDATFSQEKIQQITSDLAREFGGLPTDQAAALYQAISAGATEAGDATTLLTVANRLAIGGVTDVETAVDGLTTVINSYGLDMSEAVGVSDALFVAMRAGKTTVGEMSSAIGKVTPLAATLGVNFDEVGASLATLTAGGLSTREAVTGLRAALTGVLKPSDGAEKAAKKLDRRLGGVGIRFSDARKKGVIPFLIKLGKLRDEGKVTNEQLAKMFPNIRGLGAILTATSEAGGSKFVDTLEEMKEKSGATGVAFAKMENTLSQRGKRAEAQLELLKIQVGEQLAPAMGKLLEDVVPMIESFAEWLGENEGLVKSMGPLVIGIVGVTSVLGPLFQTASAVSGVIGSFRVARMVKEMGEVSGDTGAAGKMTRSLGKGGKALVGLAALGAGFALSAVILQLTGATDELNRMLEAIDELEEFLAKRGIKPGEAVDPFDLSDVTEEEFKAISAGTRGERQLAEVLADPEASADEKSQALAVQRAASAEAVAAQKSARERKLAETQFTRTRQFQSGDDTLAARAGLTGAFAAITGRSQGAAAASLRVVVEDNRVTRVEIEEAEGVDVDADTGPQA